MADELYEVSTSPDHGDEESRQEQILQDANQVAASQQQAAEIGNTAVQQPVDPNAGGIPTSLAIEDAAKQSSQLPEGAPQAPAQADDVPAFTNQDFYPNDPDPAQYRYETGLEVVARQGRMPMGAISKAAAHLQNRQNKLEQKIAEFDLYSQIGKTADPYQRNFVRISKQQNDNFVKQVADAYYKGNERKAIRAIATDPTLRARWRGINQDMEALGTHGKYAFDEATKYIQNGAKGMKTSAEGRDLALDIIYGMGEVGTDTEGGDIRKMLNKMQRFEHILGRDTYFNERVMPQLKEMDIFRNTVNADTGLPFMLTGAKGRVIMTETQKLNFDSLKEAMAASMVADGIETLEEARKYLDQRLPEAVVSKSTMSTDPVRSGGSDDNERKTALGEYDQVVSSALLRDNQGKFLDVSDPNTTEHMVNSALGATVWRRPLVDIVGDRPAETNAIFFTKDSGGQVKMKPNALEMDQDGNVYLVGVNAEYEEVYNSTFGEGSATSNTTTSGTSVDRVAKGEGFILKGRRRIPQWVAVPYSKNVNAFKNAYGITRGQVMDGFPPLKESKFSTDAPSKAEEADIKAAFPDAVWKDGKGWYAPNDKGQLVKIVEE